MKFYGFRVIVRPIKANRRSPRFTIAGKWLRWPLQTLLTSLSRHSNPRVFAVRLPSSPSSNCKLTIPRVSGIGYSASIVCDRCPSGWRRTSWRNGASGLWHRGRGSPSTQFVSKSPQRLHDEVFIGEDTSFLALKPPSLLVRYVKRWATPIAGKLGFRRRSRVTYKDIDFTARVRLPRRNPCREPPSKTLIAVARSAFKIRSSSPRRPGWLHFNSEASDRERDGLCDMMKGITVDSVKLTKT